ncbi:hypothetical protein MTR67_017820 [Solanum verrucosum]|uniref:Uncharacterized protein n=1 Tax=Solanum verrucosum TaxID=315347 RepID=A0AAF0QNN2_SOLVR|nr:hypothetical protein MTR67_017820 [Solanum verrucosum]
MNVTSYFGATLGRVANRIGAHFIMNGTLYKLLPNESKNIIHGEKVCARLPPFLPTSVLMVKKLRGSSAGKGLGQSPSGRRFEPQQGHWRHYKPAASPGPRGTNRGGPALKQRDPVGTASRVRKATPGNHVFSWDMVLY